MAQRIMSPHKLRELLGELSCVDVSAKRQAQIEQRIEASFGLLYDFWQETRSDANHLWQGVPEAKVAKS